VNIPPLQTQKNNRELELLVQESILNTIRESIPIEAILRAYMDETTEEEYIEEIKEQLIENKSKPTVASIPVESVGLGASVIAATEESTNASANASTFNEVSKLAGLSSTIDTAIKFNDTDFVRDTDNNENLVNAPKNIDRLEEISAIRYNQRKQDEEDDDDGSIKLNISDQTVSLNDLEVYNMDEPKFEISDLEEFTLPDLMSDSNA
jgi:hypothetical protein